MNNPKRGEIYLVNFRPTVSATIRKTRPALVLQNDIANRHSPITIVAAVTSKFDEMLYPTEVLVTAPEAGTECRFGGIAESDSLDRQASPCATAGRHPWVDNGERRTVAADYKPSHICLSRITQRPR
jgi:mRNA-degrading endonuclease toxin of MazEF toxin-antitoxin module